MSLSTYRRDVDKALARYQTARRGLRRERKAARKGRKRAEALSTATVLAQGVAAAVQSQAHAQIAGIVTKALGVFDEPYTFNIEFRRLRGKTEAHLQFIRGGKCVDPLSASGGGCVDVAAFALRVAALMLTRPQLRRVLVLDEPFKNVSPGYVPRIRQLVEELAATLGLQFILVTHDTTLRCGKVIDLGAAHR